MKLEADDRAKLQVERIGGLAGFGGVGTHVRSHGEVDMAALSAAEQRAVEALFQSRDMAKSAQVGDGFRYRISRTTAAGVEHIEAPEALVPTALSQCVQDELV